MGLGVRTRAGRVYWQTRHRNRIVGDDFYIGRPIHLEFGPGGLLTLGPGARIEAGARLVIHAPVTLGAGVYVGNYGTIVAHAPLTIGRGTLLGERVSMHTADHGQPGRREEWVNAPIAVGEDSWLAAGVVVTKDVTVGDRTSVAANAVVTRDLPSDVLAAGVPAVVKKRYAS